MRIDSTNLSEPNKKVKAVDICYLHPAFYLVHSYLSEFTSNCSNFWKYTVYNKFNVW